MVEQRDSSATEKIPMEGLKVNGDMVLVEVGPLASGVESLSRMLGDLAKAGINMNLFIGGETEEGTQFACCVAASDEAAIKALADEAPELKAQRESSAPVDLLSLFPHRFDLKTLGLCLSALAGARIPMRGFCSSLSAITFITDHADREQAAAALERCFGLEAGPS